MLLLCRDRDRQHPEVVRLWRRSQAEWLPTEVIGLGTAPAETVRTVVGQDGPSLLVLCKTASMGVRERLAVKQTFVAVAGPRQWLTTARMDEGYPRSLEAVVSVARRLLAQELATSADPRPFEGGARHWLDDVPPGSTP